MDPHIRLTSEHGSAALLRFNKIVLSGQYPINQSANWPTDESDLSELEEYLLFRDIDSAGGSEMVYRRGDALGYLALGRGFVRTEIAAPTKDILSAEFLFLRKLFKPTEKVSNTIPVRFWVLGPSGPRAHSRRLTAPTWEEINHNYPPNTREDIEGLLTDPRPGQGGKLLLWHGIPGTGKTYALRMLLREWHDWCQADFVVDVDAFFGGPAGYLMDVLLRDTEDYEDDESKKWRLIIFEDAGELLAADAKERVGQGLGRLLNIVDGFIGQGLRIMLLITTNEEMGRLHPAVTRPGRAAVNMRFDGFSVHEATGWLEHHGIIVPATHSLTLAELYAQRDEFRSAPAPQPVGFGRR